MQFKQFPTTMLTKTWETELRGGGRAHGQGRRHHRADRRHHARRRVGQLPQCDAKGQDPNAQWRNQPGQALMAAFLRGGAASIYGDYLLGEYSRHGMNFLEGLAGPTFGQLNNLVELYNDLKQDAFGSSATRARPPRRSPCARSATTAVHEHDLHARGLRLPHHLSAAGVAQPGLSAAHGAGDEAALGHRVHGVALAGGPPLSRASDDFELSRAGWELYHLPRRYPRANYPAQPELMTKAEFAAEAAAGEPPITTPRETNMQGLNRLASLAQTIMSDIDKEANSVADELLAAKLEAKGTIGHFRDHAGQIRKVAADVKAQLGQISNLPPPEESQG
jgi:hypothetical protein